MLDGFCLKGLKLAVAERLWQTLTTMNIGARMGDDVDGA